MSFFPKIAMVFAAGLGTRMRHLTADKPKPMVEVCGKPLIDYRLDKLQEYGIERVFINTHYKADVIENYLNAQQKNLRNFEIIISHEDERLETGGGILKSIDLLGSEPIFVINSDVIWLDNNGQAPALNRLAENYDSNTTDFLLLLQDVKKSIGYYGDGDFDFANNIENDGAQILTRNNNSISNVKHQFVYTGIQIFNPKIVKEYAEKTGKKFFSLSEIYKAAITENSTVEKSSDLKKLYGIKHLGEWLHVDSPESLSDAENFLKNYIQKK